MSFMKSGPLTMMKEGATMVDEPILKNINASREMAKITRSSMGPYGLCKMVINHLNKLFVTHDAATILRELEVEHPAAKLLVMSANAMQEEVGDGTNLAVSLGGELLSQAEGLIRMGIHPSDIIEGYKKASVHALELLTSEHCICSSVSDLLVPANVLPPIRTAIASKMYGYEDFLADLVTRACINACPADPRSFNVDNIRVAKLDGDSILASSLIRGFVIARTVEGQVKHVKNAKVAIYGIAIDIPSTETKGTAVMETAEELLQYSKREEDVMEGIVANIAKSGCNVIVSNSTFGDLALHFLNRYNIMAVKVPSKFEMMRLCKAVGARTLAKLDTPSMEDLGTCDAVNVVEVGSKLIISFAQEKDDSKLSTIIVRGATQNLLDDIERAIDDGVNIFKALSKDKRLVAGAGACEMELQKQLMSLAETTRGLDQYAMRKFASSFEVVARTLAEVSGFNGTDAVTTLEAEHHQGHKFAGLNVESGKPMDAFQKGIVDPYLTKFWAITFAADTAITILEVDQIIVAKQAGGPKPRGDQARDEDE